MISFFSVSNFRSIWHEQSISFLSTPDRHNRELLTVEVAKGIFVNKLAIFFGSNASGKSNILKAIETLFLMLITPQPGPFRGIILYDPFELAKTESTVMKIDFYIGHVKYMYQICYNADYIESESLYYVPKRSKALFYERKFKAMDLPPEIEFGKTLRLSLKSREDIISGTFNNQTVLGSVGKLSLSDDAADLKSLYRWIMTYVHNINGDYPTVHYVSELNRINSDIRKKEFYIKLLAKADFNITDFKLVDVKDGMTEQQMPDIINDKSQSNDTRVERLKTVIFTNYSENGNFDLPIEEQSAGTLRFIELMNALYELVTSNHVYLLDELGNRMHYDLIVYYLSLFLYNSEASQLLFTSQSITLLDEDFVRRDLVYLTEKDPETAATTYERVSDMGLNKNISLYRAYRLGKLGSKPDLGSPYLNLNR